MPKLKQHAPNVFASHNHRKCRAACMSEAQRHCAEMGLRLTKTRSRVLEILLETHRALGAYDILERLRQDGLGSQPPVVYRALEFLNEHGFVHRLERLNAFTACVDPKKDHEAMFLICKDCLIVAEAPQASIPAAVDQAAQDLGFDVISRVVEVIGRCSSCQEAAKS